MDLAQVRQVIWRQAQAQVVGQLQSSTARWSPDPTTRMGLGLFEHLGNRAVVYRREEFVRTALTSYDRISFDEVSFFALLHTINSMSTWYQIRHAYDLLGAGRAVFSGLRAKHLKSWRDAITVVSEDWVSQDNAVVVEWYTATIVEVLAQARSRAKSDEYSVETRIHLYVRPSVEELLNLRMLPSRPFGAATFRSIIEDGTYKQLEAYRHLQSELGDYSHTFYLEWLRDHG